MMQHKNKHNQNELEYLSQIGYENFPDALNDIEDIKRSFSKNHPGILSANLWVIITLVGILITSLIYFSNNYSENAETEKRTAVNSPKTFHVNNATSLHISIKITSEDAFVYQRNKLKTTQLQNTPDNTELIEMESLKPHEVTVDSFVINEARLKNSINSSISYIHNLKISNYKILYFNFINTNDHLNSLPSAFSNRNTPEEEASSLNPYKFTLSELLSDAMENFSNKQYTNCIEKLDQLLSYNPDDINAVFYKGMCLYYQNDLNKALLMFDKASTHINNAFKEESVFYKANVLLKLNMNEEAKHLLTGIIEDEGFYASNASNLLKYFE